MNIRRFQPGDLEAVMRLEIASFDGDAYPADEFLELSRRWGPLFLVAEDETGGLTGYAAAAIVGRRGEIISIAVAPESRGRGLGKVILAALLEQLRSYGVERVLLMVRVDNEPAERLYRSLGFERVRRVRGYYANGADAFRMRLWFMLNTA